MREEGGDVTSKRERSRESVGKKEGKRKTVSEMWSQQRGKISVTHFPWAHVHTEGSVCWDSHNVFAVEMKTREQDEERESATPHPPLFLLVCY